MKSLNFKISVVLYTFIAFILVSCGSSRTNSDISQHSKFIAQSKANNEVVISMDTVFYKGEPVAVMKKEGFSIASFYTFYSLTGEKSIRVTPYSATDGGPTTNNEYEFFGTSSGMKGYLDFAFSPLTVCENIINNNLLSTTGLRPIDVGNFVKNHPRPAKFNPANLKVKREMTKEIKINQGNGEINQGDVKIGIFTQGTRKSEDLKQSTAVFIVKFLNQTKCAEITFPDGKYERNLSPYISLYTEFDGKFHNLNMDDKNRTFDVDAFKQAVEFMVKMGYL